MLTKYKIGVYGSAVVEDYMAVTKARSNDNPAELVREVIHVLRTNKPPK